MCFAFPGKQHNPWLNYCMHTEGVIALFTYNTITPIELFHIVYSACKKLYWISIVLTTNDLHHHIKPALHNGLAFSHPNPTEWFRSSSGVKCAHELEVLTRSQTRRAAQSSIRWHVTSTNIRYTGVLHKHARHIHYIVDSVDLCLHIAVARTLHRLTLFVCLRGCVLLRWLMA